MYDYVSQFELEDVALKYGRIYGNEKIILIKAGLGGDYLGYENKYLRIGWRLHQQYGCSIISISNPYGKNNRIDYDRKIVLDFIQKQNRS